MRYPPSAMLEIIRIFEQVQLPAKQNHDRLSIPLRTFNRRYDRYLEHGPEALANRVPAPGRVWDRIQHASTTRSSSWLCNSVN